MHETEPENAGAQGALEASDALAGRSRTNLEHTAETTHGFGQPAAELGFELLQDIELDATLQFGSRDMVLREILELGPGDVIELDRHVSEPVDLVVGDRIVARGEVVVANGNFALRITQVATPQLRLESIRCLS